MIVKYKWWRPLIKTGTYRIICLVVLCALSWAMTGSLALAASIAAVDLLIKSAMYFAHEFIWDRINIGREVVKRKGCVVWFTGLSGSGKTTLADAVAEKLTSMNLPVARLDGDVARRTFSSDLGFTSEDRAENCRRATHVASYLKEDHIVLASFISPKESMRRYVKDLCGQDAIIVHVHAPIEECARRDPKGMYAKLEDGKFMGEPFTGMHPDAKYEMPMLYGENSAVDHRVETKNTSVETCAKIVIDILKSRGKI